MRIYQEYASDNDNVLLKWPAHSPDLTPCEFFLWDYVKGQVYIPSQY